MRLRQSPESAGQRQPKGKKKGMLTKGQKTAATRRGSTHEHFISAQAGGSELRSSLWHKQGTCGLWSSWPSWASIARSTASKGSILFPHMAAWATPKRHLPIIHQTPGLRRQVLRPRPFGPPPGGASWPPRTHWQLERGQDPSLLALCLPSDDGLSGSPEAPEAPEGMTTALPTAISSMPMPSLAGKDSTTPAALSTGLTVPVLPRRLGRKRTAAVCTFVYYHV